MSKSKGDRAAAVVRLDKATLARVDEYAARAGMDRSSALAELIGTALATGAARGCAPPPTSSPRPSSSAKGAGLVADLARVDAGKPRRKVLSGFHPVTGEPIYREA